MERKRIESLQKAMEIRDKKEIEIRYIMEELKDNVVRIAKQNNLDWGNTPATAITIIKETIKVTTQDEIPLEMLEQIKKELLPQTISLEIQRFKGVFFSNTTEYMVIDIRW